MFHDYFSTTLHGMYDRYQIYKLGVVSNEVPVLANIYATLFTYQEGLLGQLYNR